jgi:hypothetical protein
MRKRQMKKNARIHSKIERIEFKLIDSVAGNEKLIIGEWDDLKGIAQLMEKVRTEIHLNPNFEVYFRLVDKK